jgi:hypothetical protein
VPLVNDPLLGRAAAAASDKVTVTLVALKAVPTSEKTNTFCPAGPTNSTSTSLTHVWLKFFSVTVTLLTAPFIPVTLIVEG